MLGGKKSEFRWNYFYFTQNCTFILLKIVVYYPLINR